MGKEFKEFGGELCERLFWGDYLTKDGHYIHDDSFIRKFVIPIGYNKKEYVDILFSKIFVDSKNDK